MKCKSCGKEVADNIAICPNCGFDIESYKKLQRVVVKEDPEVSEKEKSSLIDRPIFTFLFGILSLIIAILFVTSQTIVLLYLALFILFNVLTLINANKVGKVKLEPFKDVGKLFSYLSIGFVIFKVVFDILGALFFN